MKRWKLVAHTTGGKRTNLIDSTKFFFKASAMAEALRRNKALRSIEADDYYSVERI